MTDFKKYCNNKGATLIVVQTKKNEIFGGFTNCDWTNENFTFSKDDKIARNTLLFKCPFIK